MGGKGGLYSLEIGVISGDRTKRNQKVIYSQQLNETETEKIFPSNQIQHMDYNKNVF